MMQNKNVQNYTDPNEKDLKDGVKTYLDAFVLSDSMKQQMRHKIEQRKPRKVRISLGRTLGAAAAVCILFAGGIGVNTASGGKAAETIRRAGGDRIMDSIRELWGMDSESAEIIQNMTPEAEVYAPPLLECNEQRAVFASSRGIVIYDRMKEKAAAVIDLQKIGCHFFTTDSLMTKVLIHGDRMQIFNSKDHKVQGNCYVYDLSEPEQESENTRKLEPIEIKKAKDTLIEQWETDMESRYKDTFANAAEDTMDQWQNDKDGAVKYSRLSVAWTSAGRQLFTCLLLDHGEYQLYTWERETGKAFTESLHMTLSQDGSDLKEQEKEGNELPRFVYSGDDPVMKVLCDYFVERETKEKSYSARSQNSVVIPAIVVYGTRKEKDEIKVFGNFWIFIYYRNGNTLEMESGGENPACVHLKKKGGSYQVVKVEETGDGSYYQLGIEKFCEGYPEIYEKFFDYQSSEKKREKSRKELIGQYVTDNQLDIRYYHDFGWDPVELY